MISFYKKYYKTIFDISLLVLTVYLFMLLFSYMYTIATPIFLAFLIFAAIEPFAAFLHRRKLKKMLATSISMLVFLILILGVLTGAGIILTVQIQWLADKIPEYVNLVQNDVIANLEIWNNQFNALPPEIITKAQDYLTIMAEWGGGLVASFFKWLLNGITSFSTFVIHFLIAIILAYFLSLEIDWWKKIAAEKTPNTFKAIFSFLSENVLKGIVTYLKAQFKLISISFVIILAALLFLNVPNAFTVSLIAAIFDFIPLLGVSTIFVPWIIYLLIVGQTTLAIWLTVVLGVTIIVRQILEPKITGESLGVSAFTMLSFMIISLSIFGVAGLILAPILIILLKALYDQGYLARWIRKPEQEYEDKLV